MAEEPQKIFCGVGRVGQVQPADEDIQQLVDGV
jgi:hypothetical protein